MNSGPHVRISPRRQSQVPINTNGTQLIPKRLLLVLNLVLTNPTAIQASPNKGKKIVESSSSTNNSEKFSDAPKDEKTTSSIQNDEVQTSNKDEAEG